MSIFGSRGGGAIGQVFYKISPDTSHFVGEMEGSMRSAMPRMQASMNRMGNAMTMGITLPLVGIATLGIKSLMENEKILLQVEATIKSTGGVANKTAAGVRSLADELSELTSIGHEDIMMGERMLLTFTDIRNEVGEGNDIFDQATLAMVDYSVVMGTDMKSAAIQLGKALNDPITGLSALGRSGVTFSELEKDTIKDLWEAGDHIGAQAAILEKVNSQIGGAGEALGDSTAGELNRLNNKMEEMARTLAEDLLPIFSDLIDRVSELFDWFNKLDDSTQRWIVNGLLIAAVLGPVMKITSGFMAMTRGIMAAATAMKTLNAASGVGAAAGAKGAAGAAAGFTGATAAVVVAAGAIGLAVGTAINKWLPDLFGDDRDVSQVLVDNDWAKLMSPGSFVADKIGIFDDRGGIKTDETEEERYDRIYARHSGGVNVQNTFTYNASPEEQAQAAESSTRGSVRGTRR